MSTQCRRYEMHHLVCMWSVQEDRIKRMGWSGHYTGPRRGNHESQPLL